MPFEELIKGYFRFIARFFWEIGQDDIARKRLIPLFDNLPEGIDRDTIRGFYLTGEREIIFIGQANSPMELQKFCTSVIYDAPIEARFYHGVEIHELKKFYKSTPPVNK
ncbi:MAG: hypothetical protein JSW07_02730 [bacterium]|nr:MAG: hypothetical protein JSW07_02730 [bacterium]